MMGKSRRSDKHRLISDEDGDTGGGGAAVGAGYGATGIEIGRESEMDYLADTSPRWGGKTTGNENTATSVEELSRYQSFLKI